MKKVFALIMALVLVLSLVACGGGTTESKDEGKSGASVEEAVIGDWAGDYTYNGGTKIHGGKPKEEFIDDGHSVTTTLSIYKGGSMQFTLHSNVTGFETSISGKWELSDDVLVITYTYSKEETCGFEVDTNSTPNTLTTQGTNIYFPAKLTKQ